MRQILLFPDPSPLVERLGLEFFRNLPEGPGVYLMKGPADALLYVGKARNLRRRLGSYRVANPDRMPRRHLRLLRAVARIEIQECADERSALERETHLLRTLKPRFNRAGTWPGTPKFLVWRATETGLHLSVTETPEDGWKQHGPAGAGAWHLRAALLRLLWLALCKSPGFSAMPAGWFRGHCGDIATLRVFDGDAALLRMDELFSGGVEPFTVWVLQNAPVDLSPFEKTVLDTDLELLANHLAI